MDKAREPNTSTIDYLNFIAVMHMDGAAYSGGASDAVGRIEHLLIINNFGDLSISALKRPWDIDCIESVIDRRYSLKLPTVINSNITWEQIADLLGERILRRLISGWENGYFKIRIPEAATNGN